MPVLYQGVHSAERTLRDSAWSTFHAMGESGAKEAKAAIPHLKALAEKGGNEDVRNTAKAVLKNVFGVSE